MFILSITACAFLGALLSTLPIGPVNLLSFFFTLNGKTKLWFFFILGILLADTVVCLMAMHFLSYHSETLLGELKAFLPYISFLLAAILVVLGVRLLRVNEPLNVEVKHKYEGLRDDLSAHRLTAFGAGFFATAMSPGLLVFWLAWWLKWISNYEQFSNVDDSLAAAFGLCAGDLLIFFIYRYLALKFGPKLIGTRGLKQINRGIGCALIIAAALLCLSF